MLIALHVSDVVPVTGKGVKHAPPVDFMECVPELSSHRRVDRAKQLVDKVVRVAEEEANVVDEGQERLRF